MQTGRRRYSRVHLYTNLAMCQNLRSLEYVYLVSGVMRQRREESLKNGLQALKIFERSLVLSQRFFTKRVPKYLRFSK